MSRKGSALIIAIVLLSIILGASISIVSYTTLSNRATTSIDYYTDARHIAEAGIEKALWCIRQTVGTNCGGTYGVNYAGESNIPFGSGVFTVTLTAIDSSTKKVESTGYIPNAVNPKKKVTLRTNIEINSQGVGLVYGMQVGAGGIDMDNNSKIVGSVFSAGSITGKTSNNSKSTITGDVQVARTIVLTKDQERNIYNTDFPFGKTNTTERFIAQSFVATTSSLANFISLYIKKVSTPDDLNIWLARDNNGEPLASMEQVGTINASSVGTNYTWIQADIANRPIIEGKTYWIVLGPDTSSATQYYVVGFDNTNGYANGAAKASPSKAAGSWVAQNGDINFALYLGGVDTIVDGVNVNGSTSAATIQHSTIGGVARTKTLIDDTTVTSSAYSTTISNSTVTGDAYANTITNSTVHGSRNAGTGIDPPYQVDFPFTAAEINEWKAGAAVSVQNGDYTLPHDQSATLGPKKIVGNVSIGNKSTLTLSGVLYITGDLFLDNNSIIKVDPSYGSLSGVIIVDGTVTASQGVTFKGSGQASSYLLVASLAQDDGTYNGPVISVDNGTTGVIFFAPYGMISLSENATAKQITALKIKLQENATITYDSGLASTEFSVGPQAGWAVVPGSFQEVK